mgnify:CR=1 FL=1
MKFQVRDLRKLVRNLDANDWVDLPDNNYKPKRYHKSDTLVYEYSLFYPESETTSEFVTREKVLLCAEQNAQASDIAEEFLMLRMMKDDANRVLKTCTIETDDFVIGLTVTGFSRAVEKQPIFGSVLYEEAVMALARDLVTIREGKKNKALLETIK